MREYVRPMMMSEAFAPNEYIATCYTLVCAIPGSSDKEIGDGTTPRWHGLPIGSSEGYPTTFITSWDTLSSSFDRQLHGSCGQASTSFNTETGNAFEHDYGGGVKNAPIENVEIGSLADNGYYYATWTSSTPGSPTYNHYGFAIPNNNSNYS